VGGTQLQLYYISTELAKRKHKVSFLTSLDDTNNLTRENIELIDTISTEKSLSKVKSGFKLLIEMFKTNADVYFTSSDNTIPGIVNIYCSLTGKRHIHRTVHTRELDGQLIKKNRIKGAIHRIGIKNADHVFVQAKEHKEMFEKVSSSNVTVLKNCFPLERFEDRREKEDRIVLWIGRRVEWKRPELFLDLAEKFESEQFVMISPRTSANQRFHQKIEDRAKTIDNLELVERAPRDEIKEYFKKSKLFVNTSIQEGFPNTFVESGIYETPILSLNINPDNFLSEYDAGMVSDDDFEIMCKNLDKLLSDRSLRRHMGKNCRQYVEENHSLTENIRIIENVLKEY